MSSPVVLFGIGAVPEAPKCQPAGTPFALTELVSN